MWAGRFRDNDDPLLLDEPSDCDLRCSFVVLAANLGEHLVSDEGTVCQGTVRGQRAVVVGNVLAKTRLGFQGAVEHLGGYNWTPGDVSCSLELRSRELRDTEMRDEAIVLQVLHGAESFFDRHARMGPVNQQQTNVLGVGTAGNGLLHVLAAEIRPPHRCLSGTPPRGRHQRF